MLHLFRRWFCRLQLSIVPFGHSTEGHLVQTNGTIVWLQVTMGVEIFLNSHSLCFFPFALWNVTDSQLVWCVWHCPTYCSRALNSQLLWKWWNASLDQIMKPNSFGFRDPTCTQWSHLRRFCLLNPLFGDNHLIVLNITKTFSHIAILISCQLRLKKNISSQKLAV